MKSRLINRILLLSAFVLGSIISSNAQEATYMKCPKVFLNYISETDVDKYYRGDLYIGDITDLSGEDFYVYSDRSENPVFNSKSTNDPTGIQLDYMEKVDVKKVSGDWLNIYKKSYRKGNEIKDNVELGWIHASKVLLNLNATKNNKGILQKKMVLTTLDLEQVDRNTFDENKLDNYFYSKPSAESSSRLSHRANRLEIYYVLKRERGAALISKSDVISSKTSEEELRKTTGWMPEWQLTSWDTRMCLELNTNPDVYTTKEIPVYSTQKALQSFKSSQYYNNKEALRTLFVQNERPDAFEFRLPIIENINKIDKKVAVIARLKSDENSKSKNITAEAQKKVTTLKQKIDKINILFVIDGTESMSKYYQSIVDGIKKASKRIESNELRIGYMIYRDYADGAKVTEYHKLSDQIDEVTGKLIAVKCFSNDNDLPEAQYMGLVEGVQKAFTDKSESNVVVLIGDAGNHQPDPKGFSKAKVIDELTKKQVSLIAFQVINGSDQSFMDFNWDVQDYLRKSAWTYVESKDKVKLEQHSITNTYRLGFVGLGNKESDIHMFGRFTYASGTAQMSVDILENNIVEAISSYKDRVNGLLAKIEGFGNEGPTRKGATDFDPEFERFLKNNGLTDEQIRILKRTGEFSAKGYTSTEFYGNDAPCFVPVMFISKTELKDMKDKFKYLARSSSATSKKQQFQDALIELAQKMLGEKNDANIKNRTVNEIWQVLLGIDFTGDNEIGRKKVWELNQVSDSDFDSFYSKFSAKLDRFLNSEFDDEFTEFELADQKFYWIPLSEVPGNE